MKAITLLLAAVVGAGFFFRDQLQPLAHWAGSLTSHHQAPAGVYYLRTAYSFATSGGSVRWSPGQELRTSPDTLASHGFVTLTDGVNTTEVPQTAVTTDMDDAVALRQLSASNQDTLRQSAERETNTRIDTARQADAARQAEAARQVEAARQANANRIVSGQFHSTTLDAPAVHTNLRENIVSTAGAPVLYYPYVVNNPGPTPQVNQVRGTSNSTRVRVVERVQKPSSTPVPSRNLPSPSPGN